MIQEYHNRIKEYEEKGMLSQTTLVEELYQVGALTPTKKALIDRTRQLSYQELIDEIEKCSCYLRKVGFSKNEKVLLQLPNSVEFVIVLFSLFKLGIAPVLLLPNHREAEIKAIGQLIEATSYIGISQDMGVDYAKIINNSIEELPKLQTIILQNFSDDSFEKQRGWLDLDWSLYGVNQNQSLDTVCKYRDTAVYLLSGGTTGVPKVIPKIHEAYLYNAKAAAKRCEFNNQTIYLAVLSAAHDLTLANPGILGTLFCGGTVVMSPSASFDEVFSLIKDYGVTVTTIVPTIASMWVEVLEWYSSDFSTLQQLIIGAAKIDKTVLQNLVEKMKVRIQQGYGLGEGITCFTSLEDREEVVFTTQGKPISSADELKLVDALGQEVATGVVGEIIERGPYTFSGYYKNDELNQKCFTPDGFFKTGDTGKLDQEGNLTIVGRVMEQINRAGENIIPSEIEFYIERCQGIEKACVFGIEDKDLGEKVVACLITSESLDKKQLVTELLNIGLPRFKIPDIFKQVEKFPLKNIGKVDKLCLKKQVVKENYGI